ncbi:hypothetical protein [Subtercola endophyticus]|uniref:hypothetical protein n=1 Tax=Subtercola endophyticus TaxID=2895559 RepID=UPI001E5C1682|nr:hypothetical protein [Subtercola endophyticus]UFS57846.1 hypothetical protein LQ955_12440 [Subtercola endophyticus]
MKLLAQTPQLPHYDRITAQIRADKAEHKSTDPDYRARLRALKKQRREGPGVEE